MIWKKYPDMGRHEQLPNNGWELIGRDIYWTIKRDGQNVSFYCTKSKNERMVVIASRNHEVAGEDIQTKVKAIPDYKKYVDMLLDHPDWIIYTEHMKEGKTSTQIEPPVEEPFLILLDIWDRREERFLTYDDLTIIARHYDVQLAHLWDIGRPLLTIIARHYDVQLAHLWDIGRPLNIGGLQKEIDELLKFCKENAFEGVVGKVYDRRQIFFKEKIDLPEIRSKKRRKKEEGPKLPPLPQEKIDKCLDRARLECERNGEEINEKTFMPRFARHIQAECREHSYQAPKKLFKYYLAWLRLRGDRRCSICGEKMDKNASYEIRNGVFVCSNCFYKRMKEE